MTMKYSTRLVMCARGGEKCCKTHCWFNSRHWNSDSRLDKYCVSVRCPDVENWAVVM